MKCSKKRETGRWLHYSECDVEQDTKETGAHSASVLKHNTDIYSRALRKVYLWSLATKRLRCPAPTSLCFYSKFDTRGGLKALNGVQFPCLRDVSSLTKIHIYFVCPNEPALVITHKNSPQFSVLDFKITAC